MGYEKASNAPRASISCMHDSLIIQYCSNISCMHDSLIIQYCSNNAVDIYVFIK